MKMIPADGELNARIRVVHRKGYKVAELRDPEDGNQVSVVVFNCEWCKQHRIETHTRFFRNRMEAVKFLQRTFK